MRSRAARSSGRGTGRDASPYAAPAHLAPGPDGLRLVLAGLPGEAPAPGLLLRAAAVLLTGGPTAGARASLDAIVAAAPAEAAVARVRATPGAPLWPALVQGLDDAVEVLRAQAAGAPDAARLRTVVEGLRGVHAIEARPDALAAALTALAGGAAQLDAGLLLVVDDLHAAPRRDSETVLAAAGTVAATHPAFGAVASASHRATVGIDRASRARWTELALRVSPTMLTDLDARVAAVHGRRFEPRAIDELVRAGNGNVALVLAHAAAAWESTSGASITVDQVRGAGERVALATDAELRRNWTGRLSIGQRRCLRAIAQDGGRSDVDAVARRLGDGARFGFSSGMLDTVLSSLVQRGLVVVHDGTVELAVPGLASIL